MGVGVGEPGSYKSSELSSCNSEAVIVGCVWMWSGASGAGAGGCVSMWSSAGARCLWMWSSASERDGDGGRVWPGECFGVNGDVDGGVSMW